MLPDVELEALATELESDRVERKESLSGSAKDRIGQAICAFANDLPAHGKPGVLFVGVDDAGHPTGLSVTDRLLQELATFRSDENILPVPNLVVERRSIQGCEVALVLVSPASDPPVRYYGQVWIRVGPRCAIASRDEERVLAERRRSGDLPFHQQVEFDPHCLAVLRHYRSLMPMAHEARKPIFHLQAADGALGSHAVAARDAGRDFERLARKRAAIVGLGIPDAAA